MSQEFPLPRRSTPQLPIEGKVKNQKPSCKIVLYRWQSPELTGIETSNIESAGGFFNDSSKQNLTKGARTTQIIDNDIVRCVINKNKNSSSGNFNLILKQGNAGEQGQKITANPINYLDVISPGDWIAIYMKKDDDIKLGKNGTNSADSGLKMVGIVENIRYVETDDPNTGRPRLEYVVTGRDYGKIFENEIFFNPIINNTPGIKKILGLAFLQGSQEQIGENRPFVAPDEAIKEIIDFYLGGGNTTVKSSNNLWFIPKTLAVMLGVSGNSFTKALDTSRIGLQKYSNHTFKSASNLLGKTLPLSMPSSGTVWSVMKQFSNPVVNEFVVDLTNKNGKLIPSIQLRQIPYSNKTNSSTSVFAQDTSTTRLKALQNTSKTELLSLPYHSIKSTDIKQKNIGRSDYERVNGIVVTPNVPMGNEGNNIHQKYAMALNVPSIQRYGLRLLQANTFYTYDKSSGAEGFAKYCSTLTSLLCDWFMLAHLLYNGTIITDGTDEFVEIGQNLLIEDVGQLFHIEGITYSYEINADNGVTMYNTEFRVSRGQNVNKNLNQAAFIGMRPAFNGNLDIGESVTISTAAIENFRNSDESNK